MEQTQLMSNASGSFNRVAASLTLLTMLFFPISTSRAEPVPIPSMDASWLETLNYYRISSGLEPVTENSAQSAAALKHSIYLAKTDPSLFVGAYRNSHSENPASPYYSREGANSGTNLTSIGRESEAIDSWMKAPLHTMGLLRDNLKTTGYASVLNERTGFYETGLDVINGLVGSRTKTVTFPGDGSFVRLNSFDGEYPDPRESCGSDWKQFRGLPLLASFLVSPSIDVRAVLKTPSGQVLSNSSDLCVVSEHTWTTSDSIYGPAGSSIMRADHIVLVIPRAPLEAGLHNVEITGSGMQALSWKFTVIARPATVNFSFEESKEILKWDPSVSSQDNQIVGYTVIARDQQSKETKTYRTTETNLVTHNWKAGSYWICVQARGKVSESSCSTFWGHTIDREPEEINVSYSMRNPTLLTWRSSERSAPDAKLQSIRIELRMAGKSEILSSVEFAANVREWTLPKLNNGEYEFCVVGINSYGQSECEWESFEIAPKQNQTYSLPVTSLKVGGRVSIWNEFDNIFSLQITSADVCKAEGKVNRVEVTALKAGVCTFEISADETSNYLAFKKRYSLKVTKAISNSSQRITIECVKNEKIKYITGSKPQCPAGYRRR
jgi:uncharacterized protein YkwD